MNQQSAAALITYLNRAIGIVPTTGLEWGAIMQGLSSLEAIANGRAEAKIEAKPAAQPVQRDEAS